LFVAAVNAAVVRRTPAIDSGGSTRHVGALSANGSGSLSLGCLQIGYSDTGSGTPVVLLHSGGLSSRQWSRLSEDLATRYRVLVPDFIGYPRSSPWPAGEVFHYLLDALMIELLLDSLSEPAHLVGHSYGGFIALVTALHRRRQVRSLALVEPVAFGVLRSSADETALATFVEGGVETRLLRAEGAGGEHWLRAFVDYWTGTGAWDRLPEPARASFRSVGWKLYGEVRSLILDHTPHQAYATLSVPTLVLAGENSPVAERQVVAHLAAAIPRARAETIAGAGHMAPITHAPDVNSRIAAHLARS
jgi:pimeloyl-ACP methyl ester carboxylesterase